MIGIPEFLNRSVAGTSTWPSPPTYIGLWAVLSLVNAFCLHFWWDWSHTPTVPPGENYYRIVASYQFTPLELRIRRMTALSVILFPISWAWVVPGSVIAIVGTL